MINDYRSWVRAAKLMDRLDERDTLDRLVDAVRTGESQVLVLRGEPGVGKTGLGSTEPAVRGGRATTAALPGR
jgi:MoxR-like ATPase